MSDRSGELWSSDPYVPRISYALYLTEKTNFAGFLLAAIFYGIVVTLFLQCMVALLNPINKARGGIKWGLVVHTVAMFLFVTLYTATTLDLQSLSYIDNRDFSGTPDGGPFDYQFFTPPAGINIISDFTFTFTIWLADGLLLYRCYVTYAMNYWVIALPALTYLSTFAMGIAFIYHQIQPISYSNSDLLVLIGIPYYSISLSLNVLLTLMIVVRLIFHNKNIRKAMGASTGTSGLYTAIITMLTESCALYAVSSLLFIIPWALGSAFANVFFPVVAETQVIAPLLIILRVANKRALTSEAIATGNVSSIHFENHKRSMDGNLALSDENLVGSVDTYEETLDISGVKLGTTADFTHEKV